MGWADGRDGERAHQDEFTGTPLFTTGLLSRGVTGASITVRSLGDTSEGNINWVHNGQNYLLHLMTGPNAIASAALIGMGVDNGGIGLLVTNKKTGRGINLTNAATITAIDAYGMLGIQQSNLAQLVVLEAQVADTAPLLVLRQAVGATGTRKLQQWFGHDGVSQTEAGYVHAGDGRLIWNKTILAVGAVQSYKNATTDPAFYSSVAGEAQSRLSVRADGQMSWGGGAAAADASIFRASAGILGVTGGINGSGRVLLSRALSTDPAFQAQVNGDTTPRFHSTVSGLMQWGPGNDVLDCTLQRGAVGVMALTGGLNLSKRVLLQVPTVSDPAVYAQLVGDTTIRYLMTGTGTMNWGNGTSSVDVSLYRNDPGRLRVGGSLMVDAKLVATGADAGIAAGGAASAAAFGSNGGNDLAGTVNATALASPVAGTLAVVTFSSAHASTPHVVVAPQNAASAACQPYVLNRSTTGFSIACAVAPTASAALAFDYHAIG